jgi:hypothetical protein
MPACMHTCGQRTSDSFDLKHGELSEVEREPAIKARSTRSFSRHACATRCCSQIPKSGSLTLDPDVQRENVIGLCLAHADAAKGIRLGAMACAYFLKYPDMFCTFASICQRHSEKKNADSV